MKKLSLLMISVGLVSALSACNGGGVNSTSNPSQTSATQAVSNVSTVTPTSLPQVNMNDVKMIFNALATDAAKTTIDTQTAVNIITGKDSQRLNLLLSLNTSGYESSLQQLQLITPYPLLSNGDKSKYNEALFAAIFLADVTDSTSGSDGTNQLGAITLANTQATFAMVSHRFFGGHRLAEQHYIWSVNPGTFTSILNIKPFIGDDSSISYLNIHQGAVGDCWFLSTLGALINMRGAQSVLNNIQQNGNSVTVKYTNIHSQDSSITIDIPSDLEVATGAYSNGSGNWLSIYEQAFGSVLMTGEYNMVYFGSNIPTEGVYSLPTFYDGMVNGSMPIGQYYPAFKFLTGHEVYEFSTDYNESGDSTFKNIYYNTNQTDINFGSQSLTNTQLVTLIDEAMKEKRIVVLGTPLDTHELNPGDDATGAKTLPVDVVGTHAYAVLDHSNGVFKLRNPWGTNFTPNGPDSMANGYTMKDGVFYVPDSDVFKMFTQVDIEQIPGQDTTPKVVNGQVILQNNQPVFITGTNPLMANFVTSNQSFIQNNFTGGQISSSKLNPSQ